MKKKILYYSDEPFFGGSEKRIKVLLNDSSLREKYELIFSYRYSELYEKGLKENIDKSIKLYPVKLPDSNFLGGAKNIFIRLFVRLPLRAMKERYIFFMVDLISLYMVIKKIKPDIVHINSGGFPTDGSCPAAALAARFAGVKKIIYNVNNMAEPYKPGKAWIERYIDRLVEESCALLITASRAAMNSLNSVRKINAAKTTHIYTAMEHDAVAKTPPGETRRNLGANEDDILIGCLAKLYPNKGHRFLIDAVGLLRKSDPAAFAKIKVYMGGNGPEEEYLKTYIHDRGLSGNMFLMGFCNDPFSFVNACDIIALPSIGWEDFPIVILEAMYFGKPVIGTKIAGTPEQVTDGVTGLVVQPGSAEALENAIRILVGDKAMRERMGSEGRKKALKYFSHENFMKNYEALYES